MSSVTVVYPAKTVGRNEMPFGRDNRVVRSNTVLDRGLGPPREGEIWGSPSSQQRRLSPNFFDSCFTKDKYVLSRPGRCSGCRTGYGDFDVRRVFDGLYRVGELIGALYWTHVDADRLTAVVVAVVPLGRAQLADVLRPTVVVLHPRRRAVVERALELRRRDEDVVRDFVDDGATPTKLLL